MNPAVRRLYTEGSSLLSIMKDEMPPEYISFIVEFETFEEALEDVKKEIEKGVI